MDDACRVEMGIKVRNVRVPEKSGAQRMEDTVAAGERWVRRKDDIRVVIDRRQVISIVENMEGKTSRER